MEVNKKGLSLSACGKKYNPPYFQAFLCYTSAGRGTGLAYSPGIVRAQNTCHDRDIYPSEQKTPAIRI